MSDVHASTTTLPRSSRSKCSNGTFLALRITNFGNMGDSSPQVAPMPSTLNTVKKRAEHLWHAVNREECADQMHVHQRHLARLRLSRRRQLLHGTADPEMGIDHLELRRRNQNPGRAIQSRRLPEAPTTAVSFRRSGPPTLKLARTANARATSAEKCAGSGSGSSSRSPRRRARRWAASASRPTVPSPYHRHPRLRPGSRRAVRAGSERQLGNPFERIRLLQGDSDELLRAAAPAARNRSCTAEPPSWKRRPR